MRTALIVATLGLLLANGASGTGENEVLTYNVASVKHKLLIDTSDGEQLLRVGDSAQSGDVLRTNWRARAELEVAERSARFSLGPSTRVRLAHDRPGLLLELERGRLRALFGTESSAGERLVSTPSAVLAVRGTEYGVEVEKNGDTTVVVFDGVVEVRDLLGVGDPVSVRPGEACRVAAGKLPSPVTPHGLKAGDWDRGRGIEQPRNPGNSGQSGVHSGARQAPGTGSSGGGSKRHGG